MRAWTALAAALATLGWLAAVTGAGNAQHREAGAHEHGRGTLNIALEGDRLSMELEAPGMDITGFEHKATTDKHKAAVEAAKKQLAAPQGLFELPAAAGCVLKEAKVALEGEDGDHDHEAAHADGGHAADKADHDDHDHEHSGFRAEYAFDCKAPASLTGIGFDYFKVFPGAQRLDVTVITPKGQRKLEVSRAKPRLDLGGIM